MPPSIDGLPFIEAIDRIDAILKWNTAHDQPRPVGVGEVSDLVLATVTLRRLYDRRVWATHKGK